MSDQVVITWWNRLRRRLGLKYRVDYVSFWPLRGPVRYRIRKD